MFGQTPFEFNLNRLRTNRVVLLGEWASLEANKWKQVLDSTEIYDYGFVLLNRSSFQYTTRGTNARFAIERKDIGAFEMWLRKLYGLSEKATWLTLDMDSKLIASGDQVPDSKEFEQLLRQKGHQTPLQIVRAFLRENPDHIDAKTYLLQEVRRRALLHEPLIFDEDLTIEQDLKKWGVLAAETNNVFNGFWLGIDIDFFRPEEKEPPEQFSPLMRAAFSRNIGRVEEAIRLQPTNQRLWSIWGWMARCLSDYKWDAFVDTVGIFSIFFNENSPSTCPSAEVCVWLVAEAKAQGNWETVIKYARQARRFALRWENERFVNWVPGGSTAISSIPHPIEDFPAISAFLPHLEALLRLDRVEEANEIYDEMLRIEGDFEFGEYISTTKNVVYATKAARLAEMEGIAKIWENGELINKVPYANPFINIGAPQFFVHVAGDYNSSDYRKEFHELIQVLNIDIHVNYGLTKELHTLGWNKDDGDRWAITGADGRLVYQDTFIPNADTMRNILKHYHIEDYYSSAHKYITEHGSTPGIEFFFVRNNINKLLNANRLWGKPLTDDQIEALGNDNIRMLRRILLDYPDTLMHASYAPWGRTPLNNPSLKSLSRPCLATIESLLLKKPSSESLWQQWFFWRRFGDSDLPIESLLERIKISPLSKPETIPPPTLLSAYYEECKRDDNWRRLSEILQRAWDRAYSNFIASEGEGKTQRILPVYLRDNYGIPLIEAYLKDNKPSEANTIFDAWLGLGGTFSDLTKLSSLAREKDFEWLAREWEERVNK